MTARQQPGFDLASSAAWLLRARPADYLLAASAASASLPVIGKHLKPLGGYTAMSLWGMRHAPDLIEASARSWLVP
ncbi:MAG TPA: alpha/beta hydrolase, partial [Mycobacterium sp.]|nr:alpha/beta hydrolase [Mycobacterium sp.]